ncbi:hypothetical protein F5Y09DRAFT_327891 [Xylaria sp. FL1042]|nr:hypothetical protein F5Y09DRAFT_327891 [Xylaria sp. FL1042]
MALAPKFAGQKLAFSQPAAAGAVAPTVHTLELFLDYVCPFSAKQFNTIYNVVAPLIHSNPKWASNVQFIFRQQIQPWHPSSTLTHEAALAVLQLAPEKYWTFSDALFKDQQSYFDVNVVNETRNQTYRRLAKLASSVGVDEAAVYDRLAIPDKPAADGSLNIGNKVTTDLKVLVKTARLVGVHVSPTVIFDGVVASDISSGWTKEQWEEWADKQRLRSFRFKTTSTKTAGPQAAQRNRMAAISPNFTLSHCSQDLIVLPPKFCVYHASTFKMIFVGWLKMSTLFTFAFFSFVVIPARYKKEGLSPTVARTALCAVTPLVLVAYISSPFVSSIFVRLPPFARQSAATAQRYLANIPMEAELEITTMNFIARPRTSVVRLSELAPVNRRFGIVNVARGTAAENAARKWYMSRAVGNFYVPKATKSSNDRGWDLLWNKAMTRRQLLSRAAESG